MRPGEEDGQLAQADEHTGERMEPLWRKAGSIPPSPGEDRGSAGITEGIGFMSIFREVYEYTHPPG